MTRDLLDEIKTRWNIPILAAVRSWLPVVDPEPEMTLVPSETWLRIHARLREAERALPARTKRRYRRVKIKEQP
jgi:hypothetical protein